MTRKRLSEHLEGEGHASKSMLSFIWRAGLSIDPAGDMVNTPIPLTHQEVRGHAGDEDYRFLRETDKRATEFIQQVHFFYPELKIILST